MDVIAEGRETKEQADRFVEIGCPGSPGLSVCQADGGRGALQVVGCPIKNG